MAESKEQALRREWTESQAVLNPGEDAVDRMLSDMATAEAGWRRTRGRSTNSSDTQYGYAYFPDVPVHSQGSKEARAAEDEWEKRSLAMHAEQQAITIKPKPRENTLAKRVVRAD